MLKLNDKLNFVKKVLPDTTNIIFNIKKKNFDAILTILENNKTLI